MLENRHLWSCLGTVEEESNKHSLHSGKKGTSAGECNVAAKSNAHFANFLRFAMLRKSFQCNAVNEKGEVNSATGWKISVVIEWMTQACLEKK